MPTNHNSTKIQEGISSPIAAQILDFCDEGDLFPETLRSSDVSSCSVTGNGGENGATVTTTTTTTTVTTGSSGGGFCYDDGSFPSDFSPFPSIDAATLSALLSPQQPADPETDIISAANYPSSQQPSMFPVYLGETEELDQLIFSEAIDGAYSSYSPETAGQLPVGPQSLSLPLQQQGLPPVFDDCLPQVPVGYMDPSTSASFLDTGVLSGLYHLGPLPLRVPLCGGQGEGGQVGFYAGMMVGPETGMGPQDIVDYSREDGGGMGMYGPESVHRVYSSGDLQVMGDGQNLVGRCSSSPATLPASDISSLDESTFKVGRLSVEERKEKIHRYMKKRNERNFSKKIKYACRKTLADSRPRVRGRFAKNDEFGEAATRPSSSHHEFDDEEEVAVKEEEDMLDSSDILAHISGVNSFKYNYTLESWI